MTLLAEVEQWGFPGVESAADMTLAQRVFWNNARQAREELKQQQQQRARNRQQASVGN